MPVRHDAGDDLHRGVGVEAEELSVGVVQGNALAVLYAHHAVEPVRVHGDERDRGEGRDRQERQTG